MSSQLLVNVFTVTVPAGGVVTVPHGLRSNGVSVAPKLVLPEAPSTVSVVAVTDTSITFANAGEEPVTTKFRVERGLSVEVDAEELPPFYQRVDGAGGGGGGTVTVVNTGAGLTGGPIITSGTIDVDFGSTAGTVCEGNDVRLSNSRPPNGAAGGVLYGTYPNPSALQSSVNIRPTISSVASYVDVIGLMGDKSKNNFLSIGPEINDTGNGGFTTLSGGATSLVSGTAGDVNVRAGESFGASGRGGNAQVYGGAGSVRGGYVLIQSGSSDTTPGAIFVRATPKSGQSATVSLGTLYSSSWTSGISNVVLGETDPSSFLSRDLVTINGLMVQKPTTVTVTTGSETVGVDRPTIFIQTPGGAAVTMTSAPTFSVTHPSGAIPAGTVITVIARAAITLQKDSALGGPLAGSKLALRSSTLTINANEAYDFIFNGTYWVQRA